MRQICIHIFLMLAALTAFGQQTVTTSGGTTNSVPLFTGSSSVGNSVITQSNGLVGIGTTAPGETLDVAGPIRTMVSGDVGGTLFLQNPAKTTNGTASSWRIYNMTGSYGNSLQFWAYDNVGCVSGGLCASRFTVTDSGNVGLGIFSPADKLHVVASGSTNSGITIGDASDSSAGTNRINFLAWRDMFSGNPNFTGASIYTDRKYVCCSGYPNGGYPGVIMTDLVFSTRDPGNWEANGFSDLSERLRITAGGNVGVGTGSPGTKLEVNGSIKLTAGSGAMLTFSDGTTQSTAWTGALCGGDYAESVDASGERIRYEAGDVLVVDPDSDENVMKSAEPYSTSVAGIYSTRPGVVGRRTTDSARLATQIPMAMVGIVPTKVSAENGPIRPGDLLVTSSTVGYAMKGTDRSRMIGAVVGKAFGKLDRGTGIIDVLISLQ